MIICLLLLKVIITVLIVLIVIVVVLLRIHRRTNSFIFNKIKFLRSLINKGYGWMDARTECGVVILRINLNLCEYSLFMFSRRGIHRFIYFPETRWVEEIMVPWCMEPSIRFEEEPLEFSGRFLLGDVRVFQMKTSVIYYAPSLLSLLSCLNVENYLLLHFIGFLGLET